MSFIQAIQSVFRQYATFSGRARRSEYWYFYLFTVLVGAVLGSLSSATSFMIGEAPFVSPYEDTAQVFANALAGAASNPFQILSVIFSLGTIIPQLSVATRRFHDVGKSGIWLAVLYIVFTITYILCLVGIIAGGIMLWKGNDLAAAGVIALIIGAICGLVCLGVSIYWLVLLCRDSQPGDNQYGPCPKESEGF